MKLVPVLVVALLCTLLASAVAASRGHYPPARIFASTDGEFAATVVLSGPTNCLYDTTTQPARPACRVTLHRPTEEATLKTIWATEIARVPERVIVGSTGAVLLLNDGQGTPDKSDIVLTVLDRATGAPLGCFSLVDLLTEAELKDERVAQTWVHEYSWIRSARFECVVDSGADAREWCHIQLANGREIQIDLWRGRLGGVTRPCAGTP